MRIATFNLENLDDRPARAPGLEERLPILRPQLERLEADVICLQEIAAQPQSARKHAPRSFRALDRLIEGTAYAGFHRAASRLKDREGPLDVHNLVILSRPPIAAYRQYWHDLVAPPHYTLATAAPPVSAPEPIGWDRPVLHAEIDLAGGRRLHVFNLHLRAPLAAFIAGQKEGEFTWRSVAGWAEGFFLAAIKRNGQALEARLAVERVLDAEPAALIAVLGDMNAEMREMPLRILRGAEEDTANGALAGRVLVPLERAVPQSQRYSVLHAGQPLMLDHVLVSRSLLAHFRKVEIHNEGLEDEVVGYALAHGSPETFHAPVVAEFEL